MSDREQLEAAMAAVLEMIPQPRRRSPPEAPRHVTQAYAHLIVAVGWAMLGDPARARSLRDQSLAALADVIGQSVHRFTCDAFTLRIAQVCELGRVDLPLPPPLVEQLAALDRMARYKVARLREASAILAAGRKPQPPAIDVFSQMLPVLEEPLDPDLDALRALEPDARVHAIDQLLTTSPLSDVPRLAAALTALGELAEWDALPILAPAIRRLASSPSSPPHLAERAITAAARFGYAELIPDLLARLLATPPELAPVLPALLRALRRLDAHDDIVALLACVDAAPSNASTELVVAGARVAVGDPRGAAPFAAARQRLSRPMLGPDRLDLIRAIGRGATHAPVAFAVDQLRQLMPTYREITDAAGTNSHYCISVLHFVESLVLAITDLRLATLSPRDAVPALAWPYAL